MNDRQTSVLLGLLIMVLITVPALPLAAENETDPVVIPAVEGDAADAVAVAIPVVATPAKEAQQHEAKATEPAAWEKDLHAELHDSPVYAGKLVEMIKRVASERELEPALLWSVAVTESHGCHWYSGDTVKRGGAGEIGMMQVQPYWQRYIKKTYGIELDLYDWEDNLMAATYVLKLGGEDYGTMLSYYNTGKRYQSTSYSRKVLKRYNRIKAQEKSQH